MKRIVSILYIMIFTLVAGAQTPNADLLVNIHNVNTVQMNAISGTTAGMLVYNTDSAALCVNIGSGWRKTNSTIDYKIDSMRVRADSSFIYQRTGNVVKSENAIRIYKGNFLITATGSVTITGLPFKPSVIEFVAYANVDANNLSADNGVGNNISTIENSFGYMEGYVQIYGGTTTQQVICGGASGNSVNDISRYASSSHCIGIRYGNQNGDNLGITSAQLVSMNNDGFTINVDSKADNVLVIYTAHR